MTLFLGLLATASAGTSVTSLDSGTGTFETADLDCGVVESGSATASVSITLAGDVIASLDNLAVEVGGAHGSCAVSIDTATLTWDGTPFWSTTVGQSGSGESECDWFIDLSYAPSGFTRQLLTAGTHDLAIEVTGELEDSCSKISARVTGDIEFGTDWDNDGHDDVLVGGDDCDDADETVYPGADDLDPYDGIDQDCDGEECDADSDGYTASECGGDDCDDSRSDVHPDADEVWYDGIDQDCDGNDDDQDGDGWTYLDDCDDTDPTVYPGAPGWDPDCNPLEEDSPNWTSSGLDGDEVYKGGGGCGCTSSPLPSPAGWPALLIGPLLYRRRD